MMNDFITHVDLNILPLGSYDLLIWMDWLEKDKVVLNYFEKTFTCTDDNGNIVKVKGIPRKVTTREIYAFKMKISFRKWCKLVPEKFDRSWLVQLATGTKRKVTSLVKNCKLMMNDFITHVDLNILPLGSYDLLIWMDWPEKHRAMLIFLKKPLHA